MESRVEKSDIIPDFPLIVGTDRQEVFWKLPATISLRVVTNLVGISQRKHESCAEWVFVWRTNHPVCPCISILRPTSVAAHHDDARHKFRNDIDQIGLKCHHVMDIFVGSRDFIETTGEEPDLSLFQVFLPRFPVEFLFCFGS